ncbi:MAG TPA: hypothetical protein VGJ32_14920 [Solirubrobacteraceae bacterium]|jgi:hypothetical protein
MAKLPIAAAVASLSLALAATASADVLVNDPGHSIRCGHSLRVGVWYQQFSGGPRWARISIETPGGKVLMRLRVTATTHWRYWSYRPRCGRTVVVRYQVARGTATFRVKVRHAS